MNQDGFHRQIVFEQRKSHFEDMFPWNAGILFHQNYLYVTRYGNVIQLMIFV